MSVTSLDPAQALRNSYDDASAALKVKGISGALVTEPYDEIELTYVVSGDGAGEVQTATYKNAGTTVATLTLSYDSSNRLSNVIRS